MPLTPRQRATRLAQIRRIVMRMFPAQPGPVEPEPPTEGEEDAEEEPDDLDERAVLDAPQAVDMATLPPRAVDASLPW